MKNESPIRASLAEVIALSLITLAQASVISQAYADFFDPFTSRICAYMLRSRRFLFMRYRFLAKYCSCAHAQLQKFVHVGYFPACALVLYKSELTAIAVRTCCTCKFIGIS